MILQSVYYKFNKLKLIPTPARASQYWNLFYFTFINVENN